MQNAAEITQIFEMAESHYFGIKVPQDFVKAADCWKVLAQQGHADSIVRLGYLYSHGKDVLLNEAVAEQLYRAAAAKGNVDAMVALGAMFGRKVNGVIRDSVSSINFYNQACERGCEIARRVLGIKYAYGTGVIRDIVKAKHFLRLAAEQGDAEAQYELAVLLGMQEPPNWEEAAKLLQCAAEQGNSLAQFMLGAFYESGRGLPKDELQMKRWYHLAASQGNPSAEKRLLAMSSWWRRVVFSFTGLKP